jgi:hypothetical protein
MDWYVVKLIFRIVSGDGGHCPQFDEQLRLIKAESEEDAYKKACQLGRDNEDCFLNSNQQTVQWQFIDVPEINKLPVLADGTELYYQINEPTDADNYIKWAHHKSDLLGFDI